MRRKKDNFKILSKNFKKGNKKITKKIEKDLEDVKNYLNEKNYDELVFEKWIQCENCHKWRTINSSFLFKYNKVYNF